jgi:hypothetical protein
MTPAATRTAWIVGLAATGAAVVGVVAYASSKPSASNAPTTKPKSTLLPNTQPITTTKPIAFPVGRQQTYAPTLAPGQTPAWTPPPPPPNSQVLQLGQYLGATLTAQPTVGQTLYVEVPPGVSVTTASVMADPASGQGVPGSAPSYAPNQASLYGNGGAISIVLSGAPGYLIISGINSEGQSASTTIQIGAVSSPTPPIGGV